MGYLHIFLFFMCVNFGLGMTTIADTPLSVPTTHERCFADFTAMDTIVVWWGDDGIDNDNLNGVDDAGEQVWGPPPNSIGIQIGEMITPETDPTVTSSDSLINPRDPAGNTPPGFTTWYDPIAESVEGGYAVLNTVKNFIAGGYIASVLEHLTLTCDFDGSPYQFLDSPANEVPNPDYNPNFGTPKENAVWGYFLGGIQVIFGFLLALTLFNWLTGRSTDLGS